MPLSEDEQRIYSEIERSFYESDPEFARRIATSPDVVTHANRNMRLAALGFAAGLAAMVVLTFSQGPSSGSSASW